MPEDQILAAGDVIQGWEEGAGGAVYIRCPGMGENFKTDYLSGDGGAGRELADLANPPSGSASHEIFLNNIEEQDKNRGASGRHGRREKGALFSTAVAG